MNVALDISLITDRIEDFANQRELASIQAELAGQGAVFVPLPTPEAAGTTKSSNIELLAGSVHLVLPAGALATTIAVFVRQYFKTKRARGLKLTRSDGSTLEIRGYAGDETAEVIRSFITKSTEVRDPPLLD